MVERSNKASSRRLAEILNRVLSSWAYTEILYSSSIQKNASTALDFSFEEPGSRLEIRWASLEIPGTPYLLAEIKAFV